MKGVAHVSYSRKQIMFSIRKGEKKFLKTKECYKSAFLPVFVQDVNTFQTVPELYASLNFLWV